VNGDRTVHASKEPIELVRYDREGRWYVETPGYRRSQVTVAEAVSVASQPGWSVSLDLPGGQRFDSLYRRVGNA